MTSDSERALEIFTEAAQLPVEERAAFLDRVCAGKEALRQKVEALLGSNDRAGSFLEQPPTGAISARRATVAAGEKPGDQIGRYKLIEPLGEGGCGVVFMAEQEQPVRRQVALKIIKPGMDSRSVIARFEAERQALALMDHPNIAKIFDAGTTESGRPFFVMELVRGPKITDYCDQNSLTTEERLGLFAQVCRAVQHAHQKGVIHRDIKPSNILVAKTGEGTALPVVIDFGIAKATANQRLADQTIFTAVEMLIGTPAYMSPEQAELGGTDVDTRTDIYSLGVLLYELLTGFTPFDGKALMKSGLDEIRRVIREREPARPSTRLSTMTAGELTIAAQRRHSAPPHLIRSVRGDLDWIVMKALEKERSRRYDTANGLALDVERHLANEAIWARPPSKLYRLRKTALRNKVLFASVGIIASVLVGSLIAVSFALAREKKASVKSQQVTKFLEAMLNGVGPSVARGRDTAMLREILDETAERIGKEMANQPEVEAELLSIIAKLYEEIANARKGEELARRALDIRLKHFGPDSLEAAASMNLLGHMFMVQRKLPEAEKAHSAALVIRKRRLGDENADTATSLNRLSGVYRDQRKLIEAEAMAREALRVRRKLLGNEHVDVAGSLRNLCLIHGYAGRWAEAEEIARDVLAIRRKTLGNEDPRVASALEDLAWVLNPLKKFKEAQAVEAEALVMRQKLLGDAHPDVPRTLNALGQLLGNQGDLQAASGVLKAVLTMQRKLLGDDSSATLETYSSLAKVLQREGKRTEAEAVWREALARGSNAWADIHTERLYAMRGLGESLESQGKWPEAEEVWRESLLRWRKKEGIEGQQSMYTLRKLGLALKAAQKWPEAESVFREALNISRKKGDEDSEALVDLERMVRALTAQKKFVEAKQLLDGILTPAFVIKPESVDLLASRVTVMGRQARWKEAAVAAALAVEIQLTDHYRYHTLAGLLAMVGDRPAYEKVCQRMIAKFSDSTDPYVLERIAQDWLLLPNSGADLALMDKLADKAVTLGRGRDGFPYFQACKAMSHYRLGNHSEAVVWGERVAKSSAHFAQAKACAVMAMAHWQLGRTNEALAMLRKGDTLVPAFAPERGVDDLGESWVASMMARVSLDEATRLIHGGQALKDKPNSP